MIFVYLLEFPLTMQKMETDECIQYGSNTDNGADAPPEDHNFNY